MLLACQEVQDLADTGHHYALHIDCNGVETPTTSEYHFLEQVFKSRDDIEPLRYGYADAKESIFSFWCRSNKTGTFTLEFRNVDAGEPSGRNFVKEVTIDSADTWEFKHSLFHQILVLHLHTVMILIMAP